MNKKIFFSAVACILLFSSFNIAKGEMSRTTYKFTIESKALKSYSLYFNSTNIVFGNITSENRMIDYNWTGPQNSFLKWHKGTPEDRYDFSFSTEVQGNYSLEVKNFDDNATANVKMVYFVQALDESQFEEMRIALMDNFNNQTIIHVGYILTLFVGIATLLAKWDSFGGKKRIILYLALSFFATLFVYFLFRMIYWSILSDQVLIVEISDINLTKHKTVIVAIEGATVDYFLAGSSSENPIRAAAVFFRRIDYWWQFFSLISIIFGSILLMHGFANYCSSHFGKNSSEKSEERRIPA